MAAKDLIRLEDERLGSLTLGENTYTALPQSMKVIGTVRLGTGARLRMFSTSIIEGDIELADGAIIERIETSGIQA